MQVPHPARGKALGRHTRSCHLLFIFFSIRKFIWPHLLSERFQEKTGSEIVVPPALVLTPGACCFPRLQREDVCVTRARMPRADIFRCHCRQRPWVKSSDGARLSLFILVSDYWNRSYFWLSLRSVGLGGRRGNFKYIMPTEIFSAWCVLMCIVGQAPSFFSSRFLGWQLKCEPQTPLLLLLLGAWVWWQSVLLLLLWHSHYYTITIWMLLLLLLLWW